MAEEKRGDEGVSEITDVQWTAARHAFHASLSPTEGVSVEKYEKILDLMVNWDTSTPAERREKSLPNG